MAIYYRGWTSGYWVPGGDAPVEFSKEKVVGSEHCSRSSCSLRCEYYRGKIYEGKCLYPKSMKYLKRIKKIKEENKKNTEGK